MENKLIIIALGGNALQMQGEAPSIENQIKNVKVAVKPIAQLIKDGYKVIVTHGNGPQVGRLLIQNEKADSDETPAFDVDVCDAMSQSLIGYHIQQCLKEELNNMEISKNVVTVVTQIEVDEQDQAFKDPSKPIGPFYDETKAKELEETKGYKIKADSNRGYRRVIASPKPQKIIELQSIKDLVDNDNIVVCCGGGGIPVIKSGNGHKGIAAVIDKDKATAMLAKELKADYLAILTAVEEVAINFGKENQENLYTVTVDEMEEYIRQEQFAKGSMLPKVESVIDFVNATNNKAVITTLDKVGLCLQGNQVGTVIEK